MGCKVLRGKGKKCFWGAVTGDSEGWWPGAVARLDDRVVARGERGVPYFKNSCKPSGWPSVVGEAGMANCTFLFAGRFPILSKNRLNKAMVT